LPISGNRAYELENTGGGALGNSSSRTTEAGTTHHFEDVGGLRLHSVEAGVENKSVVVLLAGWPQTWYAWRYVIPLLSKEHHVIALELKGQGDSSLGLGSDYSIEAVSHELEAYFNQRDIRTFTLVGHDVGAWVAYAYSILYAKRLSHTLLLDAALIGLAPIEAFMPQPGGKTWQFHFHAMEDIPEMLTQGKEAEYLGWFFKTKTAVEGSITKDAIARYVEAYSRPGAMKAGFNYYRAVVKNRAFAEAHKKHQFEKPLWAFGGEHATADKFMKSLQQSDARVDGGIIKNCGHYIPEEAPEEISQLVRQCMDKTEEFAS